MQAHRTLTLQGMLIDRGRGAVDQRDRFYKTPLMIAAAEGNLEVVQFLVNNGLVGSGFM
jgi:ankyrin repeat protein